MNPGLLSRKFFGLSKMCERCFAKHSIVLTLAVIREQFDVLIWSFSQYVGVFIKCIAAHGFRTQSLRVCEVTVMFPIAASCRFLWVSPQPPQQ